MSKPVDSFLNRESQLMSTLKFIKKTNNSRLGDIELYQLNQEILFAKKHETNNEEEAKEITFECEK